MEPKASSPEMNAPNPEYHPISPDHLPGPESAPEFQLPSPEREQPTKERAPEQSAQAQAALSAQPIPVTLPTPVAPTVDDSQIAAVDDLPAVAADDDLIEKEWVDKAKQIITETRDDPARREREVGRLQTDYLKKRYGKELGAASD